MHSLRLHKASGLPMHDDGQQWRVLGCIPGAAKTLALPAFADAFPVLSENEWRETDITFTNVPVFDQGQHGSCVGHGSVTAFTFAWWFSGQGAHVFSPTSVYARINGGRDQGAVVGDALVALQKYGTCLMEQFGEDKIYDWQLPQTAVQTALRFRAGVAYKINNWAELGTALTKGMIVVNGMAVGRNFSDLDNNGVAPTPDMVAGGHCMAHYGLKKINGTWVLATRNSWSTSWGLNGNCYIQQGMFNSRFGFDFDAFAIGGVLDDPQETNTDPPVVVV